MAFTILDFFFKKDYSRFVLKRLIRMDFVDDAVLVSKLLILAIT